jgi:TPR repeat protein
MRMKALVAFLLLLPVATGLQGQQRTALVIGAQNYTSLPPLRNSLSDARDLSTTLTAKGFQVETLLDPKTSREIKDAIIRYKNAMQDVVGGVGIIFYAGHGMQFEGNNYLIPTTAKLELSSDLDDQCLKMNAVMSVLNASNKSLNILLLDACRSIPSFNRDSEQGWTKVNAPRGSIVVFATEAGKVASDGDGKNGLFTSKLLKEINQPGLNITEVLKRVKQDVFAESDEKQLPSVEDNSIGGDFYFTAAQAGSTVSGPAKESISPPVSKPETVTTLSLEKINELAATGKSLLDEKRFREASVYLIQAADAGDEKSQLMIAGLYYHPPVGSLIDKDINKAIHYYKLAALQGNYNAGLGLGGIYSSGSFVPKDEIAARKWYSVGIDRLKADAASGDPAAQGSLATRYAQGWGFEKDPAQSQFWYAKAFENYNKKYEQGDIHGARMVGLYYLAGFGVKKDPDRGLAIYRKIVAMPNSESSDREMLGQRLGMVGDDYLRGTGVPKDEEKGLALLKESADLGNSYGMWCLGFTYEYGTRNSGGKIRKDIDEAKKWYKKSSDLGFEAATNALKGLK